MDGSTRDLFLAQDGDDEAFARVVVACAPDVRRFCAWFCGSDRDVDDLTQETFLRAFRGLASYRGDSTAKSWMLSIARRACLDVVAMDKKNSSLISKLKSGYMPREETGQSTELRHLIALLPIQFREAFVLVRVFEFSYEEAATVLQCPRGTVQSRVARAREFLAQQLAVEENRHIS